MKIHDWVWPDERIDHIARHGVLPEEFEYVCLSSRRLVRRAQATGGPNPVYQVFGRTEAGRLLFCILIQFPDGRGYPVTARPMTAAEKRRFIQWERR